MTKKIQAACTRPRSTAAGATARLRQVLRVYTFRKKSKGTAPSYQVSRGLTGKGGLRDYDGLLFST